MTESLEGLDRQGRTLKLTKASDIKMRPVYWLWEGRIPAGMVSLIAGRPGIGKSLILVWLTAQITQGKLEGTHLGTPRPVIYAATEDSWEHTIGPRLFAAGADLDLVYRVDAVENKTTTSLTISTDYQELVDAIRSIGPGMLALDPMMSALGGGVDAHRNNEVRSALLEPLATLADTTGCTVVGLAHFRKATTGADPLSLINGSSAFGEVIRAALGVARDPDDEDGGCVVSPAKGNLGPDLPSQRYVIDSATVDTPEGSASTGLLRWTGETDRDVRDILNTGTDPEEKTERKEALAWLLDCLCDNKEPAHRKEGHGHGCKGEAPAKAIFEAAKADRIAERTLQRARSKATEPRIVSDRQGFGDGAVWRIDTSLPPFAPHSRHSRQGKNPGADGANGANERPADRPELTLIDSGEDTTRWTAW